MNRDALGIDIGGVIIARVKRRTDSSFLSDNDLETPVVPGAIESVQRLVVERFGERVFLISKCHKPVQEKTLHWLDHHRFYEQTGVRRDHVYFCLLRSDKAEICHGLGGTHFVDDQVEVLKKLPPMSGLYWFCPRFKEVRRYAQFLQRIRQVNSWMEVLDELLSRASLSGKLGDEVR